MLANILNLENRISMIAFRFSIMAFSYGFIFSIWTKKLSFFSIFGYSVLVFALYVARLFSMFIFMFRIVMPTWELLAWSWGSSRP